MKVLQSLLVISLGVMLMISPALYFSYKSSTPLFAVGDCIELQYATEKWQKNEYIDKIEQIGEESYRTTLYSKQEGWFNNHNGTVRFYSQGNYLKVECPK